MKISHLIIGLVCLVCIFFLGQAIAVLPFKIMLILVIGLVFAVLTIINPEIGLYLLVLVVPFAQQVTLGKIALGRVDVGTDDVFIIFIMLSWLVGLARRKEPLVLKTSLNWPIMAFFAISALSFLGGYTKFGQGVILMGFMHLFKFYEYVIVYFVVVSTIKNLEQIKKFLWVCSIVVGFIAFLHFYAMISTGHFSLSGPSVSDYMYIRIMYSFDNNACLGVYYAFFLSIILAMILNTPASGNKPPLVLFALILSFALFNTFSRSAYLGLVVSFLIISILREKRLSLIVLLLIIFSPIYMQSAILERITFTLQSVRPLVLDASSAMRITLWKQAFELFLSSPLIGTGYWTSRFILGEAHSQYFTILAETGIIGFSIFCWLIIRMLKNSIMLMKKADTDFLKSLGLGYLAGFSAILTTCFFGETLGGFRVVGSLWIVTGLITSANRLLSEKSKNSTVDIEST